MYGLLTYVEEAMTKIRFWIWVCFHPSLHYLARCSESMVKEIGLITNSSIVLEFNTQNMLQQYTIRLPVTPIVVSDKVVDSCSRILTDSLSLPNTPPLLLYFLTTLMKNQNGELT